MRASLSGLLALPLVAACASAPVVVPEGPWQVSLTDRQARALAELDGKGAHSALAISPSGAWANAWNRGSAEAARADVLQICNGFVDLGEALCLVHTVDGERVVPDTVRITNATAVFDPDDPTSADGFFDRNLVAFASDGAAAAAEFERLLVDGNNLASMPRDTALEQALKGTSLIERSGQVIWLGSADAGIVSQGRSGPLEEEYGGWRITENGLLCLTFGRWKSTGKEIGTKCMVLRQLSDGRFEKQWASNGITRRGIVVKGDARFPQAR